jgi:hypothetical protein
MKNFGWLCIASLLTLMSCQSDYERMLSEELASGERNDSLFLGVQLGMTKKEFYAHCWELNKKGLIRQGDQNTSVWHGLDDDLNHPANMNFYPTFEKDKIYEMPVIIDYRDWAPWNKELFADSLLVNVVTMMEDWYGGEFLKLDRPDKGTLYVKVDGNRRILAYRKDDQYVKVLFTDMQMRKELNKEQDGI